MALIDIRIKIFEKKIYKDYVNGLLTNDIQQGGPIDFGTFLRYGGGIVIWQFCKVSEIGKGNFE